MNAYNDLLNRVSLRLNAAGYNSVLNELKTWTIDQLASVLLEAILQRNRLLSERRSMQEEAKNIMGGGLAKQRIGGKDK